jgi:hypothetical protein
MKQLTPEFSALKQAVEPQAATSLTASYANLANYAMLEIIISLDISSGTDTGAVALQQATSAAGAGAKALGFDKMWANLDVAANGSTETETAVTSDTFNAGGAAKRMTYRIVVNADSLDSNNDFDHVNVTVGDITNGTIDVLYRGYQPRYRGAASEMPAL